MAIIQLKLHLPSQGGTEGTQRFRVTHLRTTRDIDTGLRLSPDEWDATHAAVLVPTGAVRTRRDYLLGVKARIAHDLAQLGGIVAQLENSGRPFTAQTVVERHLSPSDSEGFVAFARRLIDELRGIGRERTAETYTCALNSFVRFRNGCDIALDHTDGPLMTAYESYLRRAGVCPNTTSFYLRNLRAIYNRAVEQELTPQRHPFRPVYTGVDKTVKRAVPLKVVRQICNADLSQSPGLDYARDLFMFSFLTRGMSFVDMAFLRKTDLRNGTLAYRRRKTGQQLFVKWEKPMQDIVDKYATNETPYLLPIVRRGDKDEWLQYKNARHLVNERLKKLGTRLGVKIPLTTYVARHAWASIAKSKNVPLGTISEAMGHDSEKTTRIYLASLDTSGVDKANRLILKYLF